MFGKKQPPPRVVDIWQHAGAVVWQVWDYELTLNAAATENLLLSDVNPEEAANLWQLLTLRHRPNQFQTPVRQAIEGVAGRLWDTLNAPGGHRDRFQKVMFYRQSMYAAAEMYWTLIERSTRAESERIRDSFLIRGYI